jgi:hypothetical protein
MQASLDPAHNKKARPGQVQKKIFPIMDFIK